MNRRSFLASGTFASIAAAGFRPRYIRAAQLAARHGANYRELGVRPLINAAGTYSVLSGSLMPERARAAMFEGPRMAKIVAFQARFQVSRLRLAFLLSKLLDQEKRSC